MDSKLKTGLHGRVSALLVLLHRQSFSMVRPQILRNSQNLNEDVLAKYRVKPLAARVDHSE